MKGSEAARIKTGGGERKSEGVRERESERGIEGERELQEGSGSDGSASPHSARLGA